MSCTNCNKSNCTCSDNCPNKASDITVFDCNSFNVIEVPCEASLCDVLGLLESYTTNMVNELSDMTSVVVGSNCIGLDPGTYSVQQIYEAINIVLCNVQEEFGSMRAQDEPSNLDAQEPSVDLNLKSDGVIQVMSEVYDDDNAYDPLTGIWTCPTTGRYNLNFYIHLTKPIASLTGFSDGMIIAGIVSTSGINFYCVDSIAFNQPNRHADMTGTSLGMNITAGTQLQLNILNTSNVNYTPIVGDVARMVIQRVK